MDQFAGAFVDCDTLFVLPIYAASENPIPGVSGELLAGRIKGAQVTYVQDFPAAIQGVVGEAREGDLIITLGAGSVSQLAPQILAALGDSK